MHNLSRDELAKIVHKALGDVTGIHDTSDKEDREIADAILAAGYSKDSAAKFVLRERERELLELKGPCRVRGCMQVRAALETPKEDRG
jgi:hypothetical protein